MNAANFPITEVPKAPLNFSSRAVAYLRNRFFSNSRLIVVSPSSNQATQQPARRIPAISAAGRQSAGNFGRTIDAVTTVKVSTALRSVSNVSSSQIAVRPRIGHSISKTTNRIVIIR
jgi:hypothetical protein